MNFKSLLIVALSLIIFIPGIRAQEKVDSGYKFTLIKELPHTSVKDQYRTSTCWSFAGASFIESEILRLGKPEVDLSEMFLVNHCYRDKADRYVRMQGNTNFGEGGLLHDILYVMKNYVYSQLLHATPEHAVTISEKILDARGELLIPQADVPLYNEYLSSLLRSDKMKGKDAGKLKALLIRENSKIIIKDLFDNPRSGEKIKQTQAMVGEMIDSIMENKDTIYDLLSIRGYDYYTYTHSVNVCVLSVGLGVAVNLNQMQVEMLGIGAMLHDIGKSVIPQEIVNKQGKLDDTEYRIIKTHVAEGEKILKENHRLSPDSLSAVTQHHEKISGKGYPLRLAAKDITLCGRITAIADCYDALTTTRPYRQSLSPFKALGIIAKETGNYDPDLLRVFVKMLGKI